MLADGACSCQRPFCVAHLSILRILVNSGLINNNAPIAISFTRTGNGAKLMTLCPLSRPFLVGPRTGASVRIASVVIMTWKFVVINSWLVTLALAISPGQGSGSTVEAGPEVQVKLGEPVIVALSELGEMRWGYHQYPALFRLPEGRIGLGHSHKVKLRVASVRPGPRVSPRNGPANSQNCQQQ